MPKLTSPLAVAMILACLGPSPSRATSTEDMVCGREEVVTVVARTIRRDDIYARTDPSSVIESGTATENTVRCTIRADRVVTDRLQPGPEHVFYFYEVAIVRRRFQVAFYAKCPFNPATPGYCDAVEFRGGL